MSKNPYMPIFGEEPIQAISRKTLINDIIEGMSGESPSRRSLLITGVRGSGKTVLMNEIASTLKKDREWTVIRLNPERNLLEDLMHKLASDKTMHETYRLAKINLSFFGLGIELSEGVQITNVEVAIQEMLESMRKKKKKVLVCIDEVANQPQVREFLSSYQIFIGEKLPINLLCTGLYENVEKLKNEKHMTFLYRMPKIEPPALSISAIARNYGDTIGLDDNDAYKLARLTKGYSFAFQALGYFCYNEKKNEGEIDYHRVRSLLREKLETDAYEKIWAEMSEKDRALAIAIANSDNGKISELKSLTGWDGNYLNQYRKRLIRSGIAIGDTRGYLHFALPLFRDFVLDNGGPTDI